MPPLKHKLLAEKFKFNNLFRIEYTLFNWIGIDLAAMSAQQALRRPWITISTTLSTCIVILAMCSYNWKHLDNLDIVCDALTFIVQSVLALWKAMIIVYKRGELVELLQLIWQKELDATETDTAIIAMENKTHWRISSTYFSVTMVTGVMVCFLPIFVCTYAYWTTGEFPYLTPFPADYGFDIKSPFKYSVIYLISLGGIHLIVLGTISVDCLYSWCIYNVTAQYKILRQKVNSLEQPETSHTNIGQKPADSIIACIEQHQAAIVLAEKLRSTFQPIVLLEFTLNSTELCVIVFQIGRRVELSKMIFLFSAVATILVQLLLYSYGGQQLENESEKCAWTFYKNLQWQHWSIRERKLMLLSILRAQKPNKMTAIFFDVNVKTFVWVLRTAASYVTLLWSVAKT